MKKFVNLVTVIIIFATVFTSCEKLDIEETNPANFKQSEILTSNDLPTFSVEQGILVFESQKDFDEAVEVLNNMDYETYCEWRKIHNVPETMYDIYHRAIKENDSLGEYYESLSEEEWNKKLEHETMPEFSDYTKEMAKKGLLDLVYNDTMAIVRMPTWAVGYAKVLTPDGKVIVGNDLFEYKRNSLVVNNKTINNKNKFLVDWTPPKAYKYIHKNNKLYKIELEARYVQYYTTKPLFRSIYVANLSFYKYRRGKWVDKNTRWHVNGFYVREHTSKNGDFIRSENNINIYHNSRDNFIQIVHSTWTENVHDYLHTPRISTNSYTVETLKGTRNIHHNYPSETIK